MMKNLKTMLAIAATAAATLAAPPALAGEEMNAHLFQKMCDTDKDGMVSKAEAMKMAEKMFDKHDTKKRGMLDKEQLEAFLKDFTMLSGG